MGWKIPTYAERRGLWLLFYLAIGVSVLLASIITDVDVTYFGITGGAFGTLCSFIVLYNLWRTKSGSATSMLFWRAVCDFGVGLRFFFGVYWNYYQCGDSLCGLDNSDNGWHNCWAPSSLLEFFELSSEAWFLCVAIDLLQNTSDPFSSTKARLRNYHIFCWTVGGVMGLICALDKNIYGIWYITSDVSKNGFCWISNHLSNNNSVNYRPWIMFYVPLLLVYSYSLYVIIVSYLKLKLGISKTFQHRVNMLCMNALNVTVYMIYWTFVLFLYGFVNEVAFSNPPLAKWVFNILIFSLAAKGFSDLAVFIIANEDGSDQKFQTSEFNAALREEVLHFATTGITVTAARAIKTTESKRKTVLSMSQGDSSSSQVHLSPLFFIKLMFGSRERMEDLMSLMFRDSRVTSTSIRSRASTKLSQHIPNPLQPISQRNSRFISQQIMVDGSVMLESPEAAMDEEMAEEIPKSGRFTAPSGFEGNDLELPVRDSNANGGIDPAFRFTEVVENEAPLPPVTPSNPVLTNLSNSSSAILEQLGGRKNKEDVVTFTEYEPYYFRQVRIVSNVDDECYRTAFKNTIKERLTEGGASGAFFFFSRNEQFIAKSCTDEEIRVLVDNVVRYTDYLTENRGSFITRILGAYRLHIYETDLNFFVMRNIFLTSENEIINEKYDLKGSWVARNAKPPRDGQRINCTFCNQSYVYRRLKNTNGKRRGTASVDVQEQVQDKCRFTVLGHHEPNVILKDNDLKHKIRLPSEIAKKALAQLKKDAQFLCSNGIMDYSLLVGVHNTEYEVEDFDYNGGSSNGRRMSVLSRVNTDRGTAIGNSSSRPEVQTNAGERMQVSRVVGPEAYYMGIVDYQQKWDWNKRIERFIKTRFKGADPAGLSSIEPLQYRDRFVRRLEELMDVDTEFGARPSNGSSLDETQ